MFVTLLGVGGSRGDMAAAPVACWGLVSKQVPRGHSSHRSNPICHVCGANSLFPIVSVTALALAVGCRDLVSASSSTPAPTLPQP